MAVFDGVRYILSSSLPPTRRHELASILDLNGATTAGPHTHLIALGGSYSHKHSQDGEPENSELKVVSDNWVDRSIVMGKLQPEQYYAPDPAMIFSGIVACATDLPASDVEVLSAGITALGGQWRIGLTRDVTHLFALRPGSDKYNTAIHFAPHTHMSIITPHWFDDSVRLGRRLPEAPYLWPDPLVLRPGHRVDDDGINDVDEKRKRQMTNDTSRDDPNISNVIEKEKVWGGRKIFLSRCLELSRSQRDAVEAGIRRSGGIVVKENSADDDDEAEERAVGECDVFVTRWRSGRAYFKAARSSTILIGTLTWLFSVESSGTLHSPLDSLLWYPVPRGGVPGLSDLEISITNYTGAARDYLKRLITLMGAKFTPSLSVENKVLVAGFQHSPKTKRALAWSIPIVNHTWVEDCFVEWRALTVGLERYVVFPPGIDFGKLLMDVDNNGGGPSLANGNKVAPGAGAVPGGRGVGVIDVEAEERRDAKYERNPDDSTNQLDGLHPSNVIQRRLSSESRTPNGTADRGRGRKLEKGLQSPIKAATRSHSRVGKPARESLSTKQVTMDMYVDQVIEIPGDEDDRSRLVKSKLRAPPSKASPASKFKSSTSTAIQNSASKPSSSRAPPAGQSTSIGEVEEVVAFHGDDDGHVTEAGGLSVEDVNDVRMNIEDELLMKPDSRQLTSGTQPKADSKGKRKASSHSPDNELVLSTGAESIRRSKSTSTAKPNSIAPSVRSRPRSPSPLPEPEGQRPKFVRRSLIASRARSAHSEIDDQQSTNKDKRGSSRSRSHNEKEFIHLSLSSDSDSEPARPSRRRGAPALTPVKSGMKPKPKPTPSQGEVGEETSDPNLYAGPKDKIVGKKQAARNELATSQTKAQMNISKSTTKHIVRRSPTRSPSPAPPPTKPISTPKRSVSVLVPSLPREYFTPGGSTKKSTCEEQNNDAEDPRSSQAGKNRPPAALMPKSSIQAIAAEASTSANKGGKPIGTSKSAIVKNRKTSISNLKARQSEVSVPDPGDNISMVVDSPTAPARKGPRRSAANKASAKLREEIMPDVNNYEKERKTEKRRRSVGDESILSLRVEEDEEDRGRVKRRKVDEEGTKGKTRKTKQQEADEEAEVEMVTAIPKEKRKAAKVDHRQGYCDGGNERRGQNKARSQDPKAGSQNIHHTDPDPLRARPSDTKVVRLMSTGVTLSDEAIKRLTKLGVRMTSKPTDCTHLIAKGIVRTEKFLCAMSVSPYILKEEWANASIKSGKLLPEQDYLLSDPAAEKKWKFKFAEALERSKQNHRGSQLFKRISFYLTPKVPIDSRLLKAVVQSAGGQIHITTPTVRILKAKENRFVISCPEDVSIWRPLAQEGYKIYSTELILQGVLRQEVEWESTECMVNGSNS
ncbi:hypothetical protein V8B97DRAFT_700237 [Scleroderma yunnanense]